MRSSKAATAAVLAGAVALASAAYGIGTQTGNGTAEAARDGDARCEPRVFMRFDGLADALGVGPDELEEAMRDFHEREKDDVRDAFASALAEALGRSVDDVKAALREARPGAPFEEHRDDLVAFLADRFGISEEKVEKALPELPGPGLHRRGGPPPIGPDGHPGFGRGGPPPIGSGLLPG
jgi:hypothetical protein